LLVNGLNFRRSQRSVVDSNLVYESFEIFAELASAYLEGSGGSRKRSGSAGGDDRNAI
jgi:hypothetical protein